MLLILCFFTMYLLKLFLIFFSSSYIIGNDICILTDRKNITIHCINNFFENTKYLTKNDTNVTLYELNDEGESIAHKINLRKINEMMSQYHYYDNLQEQDQTYYSKLINTLNLSNEQILIFGEKTVFNNLELIRKNKKNVKIILCNNGIYENCEEQKPEALAIVNQVPEIKNINDDAKSKASDKSWSDGMIDGANNFLLELSPYSVLTGITGETVKLYFRVINKQWMPLEYNFHCEDQMGLIRSVLPTRVVLPPNSAPFDITVLLEVAGPEGSTDQISFSVLQPEFESIKVNFYIGKLIRDTTRPSINYRFNGDCRFADTPHTCASEKWSIEATIQDENSGLAMISSIPKYLRFRNEFIIGTKESVTVYYTATCCIPKIEIIATDLQGNIHKKTIDAEKQYLNIAEIGLIVLLAIILLVLILLLIWAVVRCHRKKRSRNFLSN